MAMNPREPRCPRCGEPLPEDAPEGMCPACLVVQAMGELGLGSGAEEGPAEVEPAVRYFGDYRLEEEIGRGAMGVVFRATQMSLSRTVAVKLLLGGFWASREAVERFRDEARSAARLRHPNLVSILEVGTFQEQPYFSMDFIEGRSLAADLEEREYSPREAASLLATLARAVAFAHEKGVVHRDLKPSNIVLTQDREPVITDFGLAKNVEAGLDLTGTGTLLGTPGYLPPELLSRPAPGRHSGEGGSGAPVDPMLGDVYSLGAILYLLLTGRPPVRGESVLEVVLQQAALDPPPPRKLRPSIPEDLEAICLKSLERQPAGRYGSARELAEDLEAFLAGRNIQARRPGWAASLWRKARHRRRSLGAAGLLVGAALIAWTGYVLLERQGAETLRRQSQELAQRSRQVQQQEVELAVEKARGLRLLGDREGAFQEIRRAVAAGGDPLRLRGEALAIASLPQVEVVSRHALGNPLRIEPDLEGQRYGVLTRPGADGRVRLEVRDAKTGEVLRKATGEKVQVMGFETGLVLRQKNPGGFDIVSWNRKSGDLETLAARTDLGEPLPAEAYWVHAPSAGKATAVAPPDRIFLSRRPSAPFEELPLRGQSMGFVGEELVYWQGGSYFLFNLRQRISRSAIPVGWKILQWDPGTGAILALRGGTSGVVEAIDLETGKSLGKDSEVSHEKDFFSLSQDGRRAARASYREAKEIRLWSPGSSPRGDLRLPLPPSYSGLLVRGEFSPDGRFFAAALLGSEQIAVMVWETATGEELARLPLEHQPKWSPQGDLITLGGAPGEDPQRPQGGGVLFAGNRRALSSGAVRRRIGQSLEILPAAVGITRLELDEAGRRLAVGDEIWRLRADGSYEGKEVEGENEGLAGPAGVSRRIALVEEARTVTIELSDLPELGLSSTLLALSGGPPASGAETYDEAAQVGDDETFLTRTADVAFAPEAPLAATVTQLFSRSADDQTLASLGEALEVWSLGNGQRLHRWQGRGLEGLRRVWISPDGKRLAAGGTAGVSLWSFPRGESLGLLEHGPLPEALAMSSDGGRIFSGGVLEEIESSRADGSGHRKWRAGQGSLTALALDPEGRVLASGGETSDIVLWNAASAEELVRFEAHAGGVTALAFHPAGHVLISAGADSTVKLWRLEELKEVLRGLGLAWKIP